MSSTGRAGTGVGRTRRIAGRVLLAAGVTAAAVWLLSGWYRLAVARGRWITTFQGGHVVAIGQYPTSPEFSVKAHGGHPSFSSFAWTAFGQGVWGQQYRWGTPVVSHAYDARNGFNGWSVVVWPVPVVLCAGGVLMLVWGRRARGRAMCGLCCSCGYSLAGLAAGVACPECGGRAGSSAVSL